MVVRSGGEDGEGAEGGGWAEGEEGGSVKLIIGRF